MTCTNPVTMDSTNTELAGTLSDAAVDIGLEVASATADYLAVRAGEIESGKAFNIGSAVVKNAKDYMDMTSTGEGSPHAYGYDNFGNGMISAGKMVGYAANLVDTFAAVSAVIPPLEGVSLELEIASTGMGALGVAMRSLGAAYNDINAGRAPGCAPPGPFPEPDFTDPPVSPLVIDLDGDGIELTTLTGSTVHFDFGATGFAQRTGWVRPDDGFLVFDADSNGKIDNGHELFGNQSDNGFDVLAFYDGKTGGNFYTDHSGGTVDTAHHDGVIDADDPIFAQLRVWKDLNQNGVADSGELITLDDAHITSINLSYSSTTVDIAGNTVHQTSTITTTTGSLDVADVWFDVDRTNTVAAGEENSADATLPDLHGYGVIKSLHLAMADDRDLADDVNAFMHDAESMSAGELVSQFQALLFKWADVESAADRGQYIDARVLAFMEKAHDGGYTQLYGYNSGTENPGPNAGAALTADFEAASGGLLVKFLSQITGHNLQAFDGTSAFVSSKFDALGESVSYDPASDGLFFNGDSFARAFVDLDMGDPAAVQAARDVFALLPFIQNAVVADPEDFAFNLKDAFADAGASQAIPLLDAVTFETSTIAHPNTNNHIADFSDLPGSYITVAADATIDADPDHNNLYFFGRDLGVVTVAADSGVDRLLFSEAFDGATRTFSYDVGTGDVTIDFASLGTTVVLASYFGPDQVFDTFHSQLLTGDILSAGQIGDELYFHNGDALTAAGIASALLEPSTSGADSIVGTPTADHLNGQDGDDTLVGGQGDDTLEGGAGDDVMGVAGGGFAENGGHDRYVIGAGQGHDTINDDNSGAQNVLRLVGIDPDDITLTQDGDDLILGFVGDLDNSVRLNGQMTSDTVSTIEFDANVVWDVNKIRTELVLRQASAGDDTVNGLSDAETLAGGHGDDLLIGSSDHFGAGDTFVYASGDGDDVVVANYYAAFDSLRLTDLDASDATVTRSGDDAILTFSASGGSVTLQDQFASSGLGVLEKVQFADGSYWTAGDLTYLSSSRASTPSILGDSGANSVSGTSGSDALAGEGGNDTVAGGGGGDDYFFAAGDGHDVIDEDGANAAREVDVLHLDANSADVTFTRDGEDVVVTIDSGGDSILLKNFFLIDDQPDQDSGHSIDLIKFADGEVWNADAISKAAWMRGGSGAESIYGTRGEDVIVGNEGNDTLNGYLEDDRYVFRSGDGDDVVDEFVSGGAGDTIVLADANLTDIKVVITTDGNGGAERIKLARLDDTGSITFQTGGGDGGVERIEFADHSVMTSAQIRALGAFEATSGADTIFANSTDDRIIGGQGNDELWGSDGSDTYVWSRHDGDDRINEFGVNLDTDVLELTDITPGFVTLARVPAADDFNGQLYDLEVRVSPLDTTDITETITISGQYNSNSSSVAGIEAIRFSDGSQWNAAEIAKRAPVIGTSSSEEIQGSRYGESLTGGTGDDTLAGGKGDDTYVWHTGDGDDVIVEAPETAINTLKLADVTPDGVALSFDGDDVLVTVSATSEVIRLQYQALADGSGVQRISFGDGVTWDLGAIQGHMSLEGSSGDDNLYGTAGADNIFGLAGADYLDGAGGADKLVGGLDDDTLSGSDGADTYVYASGDGNDRIADYQFNGGAQNDTLRLTDIDQADVTLSVSGVDLLITVTGTGETVVIENQYANAIFGEGFGQASDGLERIVFADGELANRAAIDTAAGFTPVDHVIDGTSGADTLAGDYGPNLISGLGGADSIDGGGMDDTLVGGAGADTIVGGDGYDVFIAQAGDGDDHLSGGAGRDTVDFGAMTSTVSVDLDLGTASGTEIGTDSLQSVEIVLGGGGSDSFSGSSEAEELYGASGDDVLRGLGGDDYLDGADGDDQLAGGTGDDTLDGGSGSDTYQYETGDGADQISDYGGDTDVLQFGAGIGVGDITISRPDVYGSTIVLTLGGGDQITLNNQLDAFGSGVESIVFTGGPTWSASDLRTMVLSQQVTTGDDSIYGTGGNDTVDGDDGDDFIFGADGNDDLTGGDGADTIDGGFGDNMLTGGDGADTFELAHPFGSNVITDFNAGDGDLIHVGSSYTFTSLQSHASQDGTDLVIMLDYGNALRIANTSLGSMQSTWFDLS